MQMRQNLLKAMTAAAVALASGTGHAQPAPDQPVRLVIGFPPGGAIDTIARAIAPRMATELAHNIVVENKPGAGGILGMQAVARAAPDGATLVMGTTGNFSITPALMPNLTYDVMKDFEPISQVASASLVLFVNPAVPAKTVGELVAYAKANPGKINYSSSGIGGLPHMAGEMFSTAAGIQMTHVAYKGSAPSISDLVGGQVDLTFEAASIGMPYVKSGRLRALAVTGPQRISLLPDVPTVSETVPGFEVVNWYGMAAPAGTSKAWITRVNQSAAVALKDPKIRSVLESLGVDPVGDAPQQFAALISAELERWRTLIKKNNIQAERN